MITKIGITSYDDYAELYYTHIGGEDGELLYSVWGKTEQESKNAAHLLKVLLTQFMPDNEIKLVS